MNGTIYIIAMGLLGVVVRVSYMVYSGDKLERKKLTARCIISIVVGFIIGDSIPSDLSWNGVELYGPSIWLFSFFSIDFVQWLDSDKIKNKISGITGKIIDKVK